jgi:hypothetical protein
VPHVREKTPEEGLPDPGSTTQPTDEAAAPADTADPADATEQPTGDQAADDPSA